MPPVEEKILREDLPEETKSVSTRELVGDEHFLCLVGYFISSNIL